MCIVRHYKPLQPSRCYTYGYYLQWAKIKLFIQTLPTLLQHNAFVAIPLATSSELVETIFCGTVNGILLPETSAIWIFCYF